MSTLTNIVERYLSLFEVLNYTSLLKKRGKNFLFKIIIIIIIKTIERALMTESKEELKSLLMKVKEDNEKAG